MSRHNDTRRSASPHADVLRARFQRRSIADLPELRRLLSASGRTVFRALEGLGYHTSFSHTGRYYTLQGIPLFDALGLWFYEDVGFSAEGTLRATLVRLVENTPAGYTHEELSPVLRLRVHDTLLDLVKAGRIAREPLEGRYVYVSAAKRHARAQLSHRAALLPAVSPPPPLDAARVIDVLIAVIRAPGAHAEAIARDLRARGLAVPDAQVAEVFARYDLGKKTARSPSKRSKR
jgi:hypothetical protein